MMYILKGLVEDFAKAVASNEEYCERIIRGELYESDFRYSPELERTMTEEELVFFNLGFKAATEAAYKTILELVDPDLAHKEAKRLNDFWNQYEGGK